MIQLIFQHFSNHIWTTIWLSYEIDPSSLKLHRIGTQYKKEKFYFLKHFEKKNRRFYFKEEVALGTYFGLQDVQCNLGILLAQLI